MAKAAFDEISIITEDFDATRDFYALLGTPFGEPARTAGGEPFHASCRPEVGAALEANSPRFARSWNQGWAGEKKLGGRVLLGLRVADRESVDRLFDAIAGTGYRTLQPPYDAFWGARYAIVEDPNGIAVGIMSPADHAHQAPPSF
jgi:uncharacterized glyoxalase superfamily protein PhnB